MLWQLWISSHHHELLQSQKHSYIRTESLLESVQQCHPTEQCYTFTYRVYIVLLFVDWKTSDFPNNVSLLWQFPPASSEFLMGWKRVRSAAHVTLRCLCGSFSRWFTVHWECACVITVNMSWFCLLWSLRLRHSRGQHTLFPQVIAQRVEDAELLLWLQDK